MRAKKKQSTMQSKQGKCNCCLNLHQTLSIQFRFQFQYPNTIEHQTSENYNHSSTLHYDFATSTKSSLYPHTQFTNPDSLPTLPESFRRFTRAFPPYLNTVESDQIRSDHYSHLSLSCLDYTGHSLFSFSQEEQECNQFAASSSNSANTHHHSKPTQFEIESKLKARIFSYLNISEDDYTLFFTPNQASAFGVLAQGYPFKSNPNLLTVYDHENEAVEAMIERSRSRGARVSSAEFKWPKLKIHCSKLEEMVLGSNKKMNNKRKKNRGLFVFPLQSKVSGARYSYQWMNMAQENGWHVLLDATGLGPKHMDTLGLSLFRPDFLISTFYRVFGQDPSGFACLFVKKSVAPVMKDDACIQSTSAIMTLVGSNHLKFGCGENEECDIECRGLDQADSFGLVLSSIRTRCLINWLVNALLALSHPNSERGSQLVAIYGPRVRFDRGPALAFNLFDWKGERVDPLLVQKLADRYNISLGCGFIKHLWFSKRYEEEKEIVLEKRSREIEDKSKRKKKGEEKYDYGIYVVTLNLGFLTNFEDVYRLWEFVSKFLDADFVEKERWRYTALNLSIIEV